MCIKNSFSGMEPIDFLLLGLFIIILITTVSVCFIYKCLEYFSNRREKSRRKYSNFFHVDEDKNLIKNGNKNDLYLNAPAKKTTAPIQRPTSFLSEKFSSPTNVNPFVNNISNGTRLKSYTFSEYPPPASEVFIFTKDADKIPESKVPEYKLETQDELASTKIPKPEGYNPEIHDESQKDRKNEKSEIIDFQESESLSNELTDNEYKTPPQSPHFPVSPLPHTLKENTSSTLKKEAPSSSVPEEVSSQTLKKEPIQKPFRTRKNKVEEIKSLFVAINLGTQIQAAEALSKIAAFTVEDEDAILEAKAIPYFIRYLDITKVEICKNSIQALANLSEGNEEQKQAIIDDEGIDPLIDCLGSTNLHIQATAAFVLANILKSSKFSTGTFDAKLVSMMTEFLELINAEEHEYSPPPGINFFEHRLAIFKSVLLLLLKLLSCNYFDICKFATKAIIDFVHKKYGHENHSYELREALIRSGALSYFVQFLDSEDQQLCKLGAIAITFIASGLPHQKQAVIDAKAIPALAKLLTTSKEEICIEATRALSKIVIGTNDQKQVVIDASACPLFVELLHFGESEVSLESLKALSSISAGNLNQQKAIFEVDAIPALMKFLNNDDLQKCNLAMLILFNLINKTPERNQDLIKHGGVAHLTKLLKSEDQQISLLALRILEDISAGNTKDKQAIIQAFAIAPLIDLLKTSKESSRKLIMNILINTASGTSEQRKAVIEAGAIPHFCKAVQTTDANLVKNIIKIFPLISSGPQRQSLLEKNVLLTLVNLLKTSNYATIELILETFRNLSTGTDHEKVTMISTSGVITVLAIFIHSDNLHICELTVDIIANLSTCTKHHHKEMLIDAGFVSNAIKLLSSSNLNICKNAIKFLDGISEGNIRMISDNSTISDLQKLLKSDDGIISMSAGNLLHKIHKFK